MADSKLTEKANEIAGKVFDEAAKNGKPLSTALASRFGSPFFYSFLISWGIMNWERVIILGFGRGDIDDRIQKIKNLSSSFLGVDHALTYYLPFLTTILVVFLNPYLSNLIDKSHKKAHRTKYVHSAELEADKYQAQVKAINAKLVYETAETTMKLEIEANQAKFISETEIANLNLEQAQKNLIDLNAKIEFEGDSLDKLNKKYQNEFDQLQKIIARSDEVEKAINENIDKSNYLEKEIENKKNTLKNLQADILRSEALKKDLSNNFSFSIVGDSAKASDDILKTFNPSTNIFNLNKSPEFKWISGDATSNESSPVNKWLFRNSTEKGTSDIIPASNLIFAKSTGEKDKN